MRIKMRKKAYFFSLDAFLASALVLIGIFMAATFYVSETETSEITHLSKDLVNVMSELKISEVNNSYVDQLIAQGDVKDLNNSVLEQIGELWAANKTSEAMYLAHNLTAHIIPEKYGFGLYANDETIYERQKSNSSLVTFKKLISGIAQSKPVEGFTSRAVLSQVSGKTIKAYAYFGGYIGDGNITTRIVLPQFDTIQEAYLELVVNDTFELYINNLYSGTYKDNVSDSKRADTYIINASYIPNFKFGTNFIDFYFNKTKYIGGGFLRIGYNISVINYTIPEYDGTYITKREYLNGIDGIINLFSSFYVPGELQSMTIFINYTSNYPFFVNLGNSTLYDKNNTEQEFIAVTLLDSNISSKISYTDMSKRTVPLRIGHYDVGKFPNLSRLSDIVVNTDVTSSMDAEDVPDAPNQSRLDVAKVVEKDFVNYVLGANDENRIGLVGYHATTSASRTLELTSDNASLQSKIDTYSTVGGDNTCFSCALEDARDQLINLSNASKKKAVVLMSDGQTNRCINPPTACGEAASRQEAVDLACQMYQNYNISIYAIGFGAGSDNGTLQNISENCSDGLFFHSNNQSELKKAFTKIAQAILTLEFSLQQAIAEGVYSALYPSSYIEMVYIPTIPPLKFGQIPITVETAPFGNSATTGTLTIPPNATIAEALITSYSGNLWTGNLSVDNGSWTTVYTIKAYGSDYPVIGDPFNVHIPPPLLSVGDNNIIVTTAATPVTTSGGSQDDRAIYTLLISNAVSFSDVYSKAIGCTWLITFEDNTNTTINVPQSYSGNDTCYFSNATYDANDAINVAIYALLKQLDLDSDGKLDVNINQQSLSIETNTLSKVPTLWGPTVTEVRVWQ